MLVLLKLSLALWRCPSTELILEANPYDFNKIYIDFVAKHEASHVIVILVSEM